MTRIVGAYVCPRGVFIAECRLKRAGLQVQRAFEIFARLESPQEAAGQLNRLLSQAGISHGRLALAIRGFGMVHHVLAFPPATDDVLGAIVDREIRRLEPELRDPVVAWIRLPPETADPAEQPQILATAISQDVIGGFARPIEAAGHSLEHVTVLPAAMYRLAEEFLPADETSALIAALPDGPFLGFCLGGAMRLMIEPPVRPEDPLPDAAAVAEEVELGTVFARQQFRGARVAGATLVSSPESFDDLQSAVVARLAIPVGRLALPDLNAGAVAAVGAVLDSRAQSAVALAGRTARHDTESAPALHLASLASIAVAALVGLWTVLGAYEARRASQDLSAARRQIDAESRRIIPVQETAEQRRFVRDALAAIEAAAGDRRALLAGLTSVAAAVTGPVRLDSILVERARGKWRADIGGTVLGSTSGHAVQALNDFYRELPRRVAVDSLALGQLYYADTTGGSLVHFRISFDLPDRRPD